MNSFNGINIENLPNCQNIETVGGLKTRLYYAPSEFFKKITLPNNESNFASYQLLEANSIEFQNENCGWSFIDILIDENEIKSAFSGPIQRKKQKSSLEIYILGFRNRIIGFLESLKNTPLILLIKHDDFSLLLGNLRNRAFFDSASSTSGKKYEDNSGIAITITANSPIYFFNEELNIITPDFCIGGFIDLTKDF